MARTAEALIDPALLVWARRSSGVDLEAAAKRAGVDAARLELWEAGEARPTVAQLRQLARLYKRPLAIFYLPEPPTDFLPLRDYRRLPDAEVGHLSPALTAAIRRARAIRDAALELREETEELVASAPRIDIPQRDAELLAGEARKLLGVSLPQQRSWKDPGRALNGWIDAVSRLDVLVLQVQSIPLEEMRGFSISEKRMPVVVLNGADFPRGRIFTLLHEVAHLLLNADGVCDVLPRRQAQRPTDEVEILCNQVAAATLMPAAAFQAEPAVRRGAAGGEWSDDVLGVLAERYTTSREAVVRRLFTLGLTDWDYLQRKRAEYAAAYEAARDEQRRRRREEAQSGGPTFYRMKVRDLGRPFIESALDAYHRRAITGSDLSEYLEIKVGQVPKLEAELALTGGARD
jgi:Zn-dependent peptidase ImmA (M78 family)